MIETVIDFDRDTITDVKRRIWRLNEEAPSVLATAINQTTAKIKDSMAEQVKARYNYRAVKSTVKINKATNKNLVGIVASKGPVIALTKFKVSPSKVAGKNKPSVYKAAVYRGPATKPLNNDPKAFIAVMKSGHKGVFQRTGRWKAAEGNRSWSERTRQHKYLKGGGRNARSKHNEIIEEKFGPAVPWMIGKSDIMERIQAEAESTLLKRIDAEIENILRRG